MSIFDRCEQGHNLDMLHVYALRLIQSRLLANSEDNADMLDEMLGDCADCWKAVAVYCAALAAEHVAEQCGEPDEDAGADELARWAEERAAADAEVNRWIEKRIAARLGLPR